LLASLLQPQSTLPFFREIYSCIGSLTVVPLSKPSKPLASFEIASKDVHNMRIRTLLEAIQILGAEKVEALRENLMSDLRNHLQSQIESVSFSAFHTFFAFSSI